MTGCDHPRRDVEITPSNSMYGGAEAYCSACGEQWHMTQAEFADYGKSREAPSKPVMLCSCGKVLETPAAYAAHCAEAPEHFAKSA